MNFVTISLNGITKRFFFFFQKEASFLDPMAFIQFSRSCPSLTLASKVHHLHQPHISTGLLPCGTQIDLCYVHECVCVCSVTLVCVWLFATLWTVACQVPLSTGLPRQEYWNGLPFPPPGNLPNPEIKPASPTSPVLQVDSLPTDPPGKPNLKYGGYK